MLQAIFNDTINTLTLTGLTQWDKGRKLYIKGLDLPEIVEIHFADKINTEAIRMIGRKENDYTVVEIPNVMLEKTHDIFAWVYVTNDQIGKTEKTIILKIKKRAKPQDFTSENVEDTLFQIMGIVNENVQANKDFKEEITQDNNNFKENMSNDFNELVNLTNQDIESFKNSVTQDLTNFKNDIEQDNTYFKDNMTGSFDDLVKTSNQSITEFVESAEQNLATFKNDISKDNENFKNDINSIIENIGSTGGGQSYMMPLNLNADFQVNQRGKNPYMGESSPHMTLDAWELYTPGANPQQVYIEPFLDGGIMFSSYRGAGENATISQTLYFIPDNTIIKYELVAHIYVESMTTNVTFSHDDKVINLKQGLNLIEFTASSSSKNIFIDLIGTGNVAIKYCRIYPSTYKGESYKENYDIDLMRCQQVFRKKQCRAMLINNLYSSTWSFSILNNDLGIPMLGVPTVTVEKAYILDPEHYEGISAYITEGATPEYINPKGHANVFTNIYNDEAYKYILTIDVELSCE